ncbi:hypothetical protein ACYJW8_13145 [Frateuria aurantia]
MRKRAEWIVLGVLLLIGGMLAWLGHWRAVLLVGVLGAVLEIGVWIDRRIVAGHGASHAERDSPEAADGDEPEAAADGAGAE